MLNDRPIWEEESVGVAVALLMFSRILRAKGLSVSCRPCFDPISFAAFAALLANLDLTFDLVFLLTFSKRRRPVVCSWSRAISFPFLHNDEKEEGVAVDLRCCCRRRCLLPAFGVLALFLLAVRPTVLRGRRLPVRAVDRCQRPDRIALGFFFLLLLLPPLLRFDPSPNTLSTTLSPTEASAPIARGIPMAFNRGRPLASRVGGMERPPRCMIGSRVVPICFRIASSLPFPISMGSRLRPASAQGKPPRCITTCCSLVGSDILFLHFSRSETEYFW